MSKILSYSPDDRLQTRLTSRLKYIVIPTRFISDECLALYEASYLFWKEIWSRTFKEIKGLETLYSDDFLKQDEISILLSESKVIGMVTYRWLNLESQSHRDDSYFKLYSQDHIRAIQRDSNNKLMIMSHLGVHPEWRKASMGVLTSELLIGLATKRFLNSNANLLISYTRNDRRINDLVYRYGAKSLKKCLIEHNVEVDLIAILKNDVKESPFSGIPEMVQGLWNDRTIFEPQINKGDINERIFLPKHQAA
jgi:hypothetical protein